MGAYKLEVERLSAELKRGTSTPRGGGLRASSSFSQLTDFAFEDADRLSSPAGGPSDERVVKLRDGVVVPAGEAKWGNGRVHKRSTPGVGDDWRTSERYVEALRQAAGKPLAPLGYSTKGAIVTRWKNLRPPREWLPADAAARAGGKLGRSQGMLADRQGNPISADEFSRVLDVNTLFAACFDEWSVWTTISGKAEIVDLACRLIERRCEAFRYCDGSVLAVSLLRSWIDCWGTPRKYSPYPKLCIDKATAELESKNRALKHALRVKAHGSRRLVSTGSTVQREDSGQEAVFEIDSDMDDDDSNLFVVKTERAGEGGEPGEGEPGGSGLGALPVGKPDGTDSDDIDAARA